MTNSKSYSKYLSNKELIFYKYIGTILFYLITFLTHPKRIFSVIANVYKRNETNRLEKTLISFLNRAWTFLATHTILLSIVFNGLWAVWILAANEYD